ncbi:hypothetical protein CV770_38425 [Bradyrhizobium sp. AC87j1]|nr:hypothetical protein CV770_38425 [Bradyrhizobium sp. AC87j1]
MERGWRAVRAADAVRKRRLSLLSSRRTPGPIPRDLSISTGDSTAERLFKLRAFVKLLPGVMGPGVRRDDTRGEAPSCLGPSPQYPRARASCSVW